MGDAGADLVEDLKCLRRLQSLRFEQAAQIAAVDEFAHEEVSAIHGDALVQNTHDMLMTELRHGADFVLKSRCDLRITRETARNDLDGDDWAIMKSFCAIDLTHAAFAKHAIQAVFAEAPTRFDGLGCAARAQARGGVVVRMRSGRFGLVHRSGLARRRQHNAAVLALRAPTTHHPPMSASKTIAVVGVSEETTAFLRLLLRKISAKSDTKWTWGNEEGADLVIVDPNVLIGEAARIKAESSGVHYAVLIEADQPAQDALVLRHPLDADQLAKVVAAAAMPRQASAGISHVDENFYEQQAPATSTAPSWQGALSDSFIERTQQAKAALLGVAAADGLEVLEVAVRMAGLALGGRAEHRGHVVETLDVGLGREIEIATIRLRLAGEGVLQVLVGLGSCELLAGHLVVSLWVVEAREVLLPRWFWGKAPEDQLRPGRLAGRSGARAQSAQRPR